MALTSVWTLCWTDYPGISCHLARLSADVTWNSQIHFRGFCAVTFRKPWTRDAIMLRCTHSVKFWLGKLSWCRTFFQEEIHARKTDLRNRASGACPKEKCVCLAEMDFNTASSWAVLKTAGMLIIPFKFTKASSTTLLKGNYLWSLPNCAGFPKSVLSTFCLWSCKCLHAALLGVQGGCK